jgi:hypothetical protein
MLGAISQGMPILGRETKKMQCGYIAGDRHLASVEDTQRRIGVSLEGVPKLSVVDSPEIELNVEHAIAKLGISSGLVMVDAIGAWLGKGLINEYRAVADYLRTLARICKVRHITILGTTHSAKNLTDARYENARERILGSAAWAGFSDTVMIVEPIQAKDVMERRRYLYVMPRNAPAVRYQLTLDEHGRVPGLMAKGDEYLEFRLSQLPAGTEVTTQSLLGWGSEAGMSPRGTERWIEGASRTGGKLAKAGRGRYTVTMRPLGMEADDFHGPEKRE